MVFDKNEGRENRFKLFAHKTALRKSSRKKVPSSFRTEDSIINSLIQLKVQIPIRVHNEHFNIWTNSSSFLLLLLVFATTIITTTTSSSSSFSHSLSFYFYFHFLFKYVSDICLGNFCFVQKTRFLQFLLLTV